MLRDAKSFSSFSVDDLDKAKEFYGGVLGLDVSSTPEGLDLTTSQSRVFLYPKPNHSPASFTVLNFIVDDIDEAVARLTDLGIKFEQYNFAGLRTDEKGIARGKGPQIAWFKDPAGNILSVLQVKGRM